MLKAGFTRLFCETLFPVKIFAPGFLPFTENLG